MIRPTWFEFRRLWPGRTWPAIAVVSVAALVSFGAVAVTGPVRPLDGDAPEYLSIAQALAADKGFVAPLSPWPTQPTMARVPLWPLAAAAALMLFPADNPRAVLRYLTALVNVLTSLVLCFLTFSLTADSRLSTAVGLAAGGYPASIFLVVSGYCELLAVFILCVGLLAILAGGRSTYVGMLLLGFVPLVRSNFIILPFCALFLLCIVTLKDRNRILKLAELQRIALCSVLFAMPSLFWLARNYEISGRFPLMSTLEGETLYGSNNAVVANQLAEWGYWIMPNQISGEVPLRELARTMSEVQVNDYYHQKALRFWIEHWPTLPKLILGKLVRGFVPIPFKPRLGSYVVFSFRAIIYVALFFSLWKWPRIDPMYRYFCGSVFLVILITTVIYYGTYRFSYLIELSVMPFIALAVRDQIVQSRGARWCATNG
jgi:hypothetical protein